MENLQYLAIHIAFVFADPCSTVMSLELTRLLPLPSCLGDIPVAH